MRCHVNLHTGLNTNRKAGVTSSFAFVSAAQWSDRIVPDDKKDAIVLTASFMEICDDSWRLMDRFVARPSESGLSFALEVSDEPYMNYVPSSGVFVEFGLCDDASKSGKETVTYAWTFIPAESLRLPTGSSGTIMVDCLLLLGGPRVVRVFDSQLGAANGLGMLRKLSCCSPGVLSPEGSQNGAAQLAANAAELSSMEFAIVGSVRVVVQGHLDASAANVNGAENINSSCQLKLSSSCARFRECVEPSPFMDLSFGMSQCYVGTRLVVADALVVRLCEFANLVTQSRLTVRDLKFGLRVWLGYCQKDQGQKIQSLYPTGLSSMSSSSSTEFLVPHSGLSFDLQITGRTKSVSGAKGVSEAESSPAAADGRSGSVSAVTGHGSTFETEVAGYWLSSKSIQCISVPKWSTTAQDKEELGREEGSSSLLNSTAPLGLLRIWAELTVSEFSSGLDPLTVCGFEGEVQRSDSRGKEGKESGQIRAAPEHAKSSLGSIAKLTLVDGSGISGSFLPLDLRDCSSSLVGDSAVCFVQTQISARRAGSPSGGDGAPFEGTSAFNSLMPEVDAFDAFDDIKIGHNDRARRRITQDQVSAHAYSSTRGDEGGVTPHVSNTENGKRESALSGSRSMQQVQALALEGSMMDALASRDDPVSSVPPVEERRDSASPDSVSPEVTSHRAASPNLGTGDAIVSNASGDPTGAPSQQNMDATDNIVVKFDQNSRLDVPPEPETEMKKEDYSQSSAVKTVPRKSKDSSSAPHQFNSQSLQKEMSLHTEKSLKEKPSFEGHQPGHRGSEAVASEPRATHLKVSFTMTTVSGLEDTGDSSKLSSHLTAILCFKPKQSESAISMFELARTSTRNNLGRSGDRENLGLSVSELIPFPSPIRPDVSMDWRDHLDVFLIVVEYRSKDKSGRDESVRDGSESAFMDPTQAETCIGSIGCVKLPASSVLSSGSEGSEESHTPSSWSVSSVMALESIVVSSSAHGPDSECRLQPSTRFKFGLSFESILSSGQSTSHEVLSHGGDFGSRRELVQAHAGSERGSFLASKTLPSYRQVRTSVKSLHATSLNRQRDSTEKSASSPLDSLYEQMFAESAQTVYVSSQVDASGFRSQASHAKENKTSDDMHTLTVAVSPLIKATLASGNGTLKVRVVDRSHKTSGVDTGESVDFSDAPLVVSELKGEALGRFELSPDGLLRRSTPVSGSAQDTPDFDPKLDLTVKVLSNSSSSMGVSRREFRAVHVRSWDIYLESAPLVKVNLVSLPSVLFGAESELQAKTKSHAATSSSRSVEGEEGSIQIPVRIESVKADQFLAAFKVPNDIDRPGLCFIATNSVFLRPEDASWALGAHLLIKRTATGFETFVKATVALMRENSRVVQSAAAKESISSKSSDAPVNHTSSSVQKTGGNHPPTLNLPAQKDVPVIDVDYIHTVSPNSVFVLPVRNWNVESSDSTPFVIESAVDWLQPQAKSIQLPPMESECVKVIVSSDAGSGSEGTLTIKSHNKVTTHLLRVL